MVGGSVNVHSNLTFKEDGTRLMRRVQGYHDLRLDGISDLLHRARGATVFDIGCNRGLAGFEFASNGADRIMGIDNYEEGIIACRHLFADLRAVKHRFEVVDLTGGVGALRKAFGADADLTHDITLPPRHTPHSTTTPGMRCLSICAKAVAIAAMRSGPVLVYGSMPSIQRTQIRKIKAQMQPRT